MRHKIIALLTAIGLIIGIMFGTSTMAKADTYDELVMSENHSWCVTGDNVPYNGSPVFLYQCFDDTNQEFAWTPVGGGYYVLIYGRLGSDNSIYVLSRGNGGEGTPYVLWKYQPGVTAERWYMETNAGLISFTNAVDSLELALDGNVLQNYQDMISWHFIWGAPYEQLQFLGT